VSILKNDTYIEMTTDTASILANGHNASPVSEVSDVVKKIIDQYQQEAINPIVNYSSTSIEDTGESMTYIFNTIFYNDAIDKCREASPTNWWWYVGADNILKYKPKPSRATHTFTFGKDFKNIKVEKNMENIINNVLFCSNNQNRQIVKRYQDVDSEDQFDDRWEIYTDSRVTQGTTADRMSNSELDAKKDAQVKVIIEIVDNNGANSGYDIESIEPGDTCKFVGFNDITSQTFTDNMQILSVDYTPDSVKLEIESLSPSIARENQENKRKIAEQEATGRASTFDTDTDGWHYIGDSGEPSFENSWVNYGGWGDARYMKDSMGFVHLSGLVKAGTVGTTMFTLPSGYRINVVGGTGEIYATISDSGICRININENGTIEHQGSSNIWVTLSGIIFKAEQ
jgi:hypothetical protein